MNAAEHLRHLAARQAAAPAGSLRAALYSREGVDATDSAIVRGLSAWAVERHGRDGRRAQTTIVFGRSRSDALRRASAPARLGEELDRERTLAAPIHGGWDESFVWPPMWPEAAS